MDIPAKQVVEAGAKLGIRVTPNLVRIVRYKMRRAGQAPPLAARRLVRRGRGVNVSPAASSRSVEADFKKLVLELGTARANALVSAVEQAIEAIVHGG